MRPLPALLLFAARAASGSVELPGDLTLGAAGTIPESWGVAPCGDAALGGCCCKTQLHGDNTTCTVVELLMCMTKASETRANATIKALTAKLEAKDAEIYADGTQIWILIAGALVFFMQCGFAMLETGSIRAGSTTNIIFKNMMEACIGAIGFWTIGYGLAYGKDTGRFIGTDNFFLMHEHNDESGQHMFFFQFAFAATAATIVSGAVAERMKLQAYWFYSIILTVFVYPVVVHWVWSADGWLSAFRAEDRLGPNGMIDYAGSGVVHTVGGWAALCGAVVLGPRTGRFEEGPDGKLGRPLPMPGQSTVISALGVLILWFGWYGFNCGSTLAFDGENAAKVATTTTLAAAAASLTATAIGLLRKRVAGEKVYYELDYSLNGILAGLVSITAPCSVVDEWCALLIGALGAVAYCCSSELLLKLHIDDPLNAWPVHGVCGVWGCLSVGIFAQHRNIVRAYGLDDGEAITSGKQFAVQLAGVAAIVAWTVIICSVMFLTIDRVFGMRVSPDEEALGLDVAEHGKPYDAASLKAENLPAKFRTFSADVEAAQDKPSEPSAGRGAVPPRNVQLP